MPKEKELLLRAFSIKNNNISSDGSDLLDSIKKNLSNTIVDNRVMQLNQDDDTKESDLISNFRINEDCTFCTMMRIAIGDFASIDSDLMKKKSFFVSDINKIKNKDSRIYKNHYYICFNNKNLVTTLPKTITIKRVETYINWLIKSHSYEMFPVVTKRNDIKLSEVSTVVFKDKNNILQQNEQSTSETENKLISITRDMVGKFLTGLLADSNSLKDIDITQIASAELKICLKKPKKMSDDDFQKTYGAMLKPISDIENVTFLDKKKNKISGEDLLVVKKVGIEQTDSGFLEENQLYLSMAKFLDEL